MRSLYETIEAVARFCWAGTAATLWRNPLLTHAHTHREILSGCEEIENHNWQPQPCNFPKPCIATLLHEIYLATTHIRIHAHTTPTHMSPTRTYTLTMERGFSYFLSTSLADATFICKDLVAKNWEIEPRNCPQPQYHILAQTCPCNYMNVNADVQDSVVQVNILIIIIIIIIIITTLECIISWDPAQFICFIRLQEWIWRCLCYQVNDINYGKQ